MAIAKEQYEHSIEGKMAYVRMLAASGLLPKIYQRQPANVLFALEYGETLGITTMAAIMGIHVIEGRPCASSGLISGLVQRAGHRLRVSGNDQSATCTINRANDPEFTFTFTWTIERAKQAKLTGKQVWQNYPAAMLQARAITECARAACQDVLYGLGYTPEELGADALDYAPGEITVVSEIVPDQPAAEVAEEQGEPPASPEALHTLSSHLDRLKVKDKLHACRVIADREHLTSAGDLTADEADFLISELEACMEPGDLAGLLADREKMQ
jgi:hypothetical protein